MLNKIKTFVKEISRIPDPFDPASLNDPLALETDWSPAGKVKSSFRTRKMAPPDFQKIEYKISIGAVLFSLVFIGAGILMLAIFAFVSFDDADLPPYIALLIGILGGGVFIGAGGYLYYKNNMPVVFDKSMGLYWKGYKKPDYYTGPESSQNSTRLSEIHAIQLISEWVRGNKGNGYMRYELNLVLKNGSRRYVVSNTKPELIRQEAKTISEFLGKPVWDAIKI